MEGTKRLARRGGRTNVLYPPDPQVGSCRQNCRLLPLDGCREPAGTDFSPSGRCLPTVEMDSAKYLQGLSIEVPVSRAAPTCLCGVRWAPLRPSYANEETSDEGQWEPRREETGYHQGQAAGREARIGLGPGLGGSLVSYGSMGRAMLGSPSG